jgi:hypothetical protein
MGKAICGRQRSQDRQSRPVVARSRGPAWAIMPGLKRLRGQEPEGNAEKVVTIVREGKTAGSSWTNRRG